MTTKVSEAPPQSKTPECCMCGDYGFSDELFQCKVCHFRSQHRYCSNLYPKAEDYGTCNWCLIQKDDIKGKSPNSSNSSFSCKNSGNASDESKNKKINSQNTGGKKGEDVHVKNKGIQKRRSPEATSPSVVVSTRKRVATDGGGLEGRLRRAKLEDVPKGIITRQGFRNKVRRYKLLDEVKF